MSNIPLPTAFNPSRSQSKSYTSPSTLKSSQIDLKRSNAKGVEGLKGFLEFAETGKLPFVSGTTHNYSTNVMVEQICDALARLLA